VEIPADRLRRCGATDDEINTLRGEYDSVPGAVESLIARLEKVADQDIRDWLADLRKAGHFSGLSQSEALPESETAPEVEVPEGVVPGETPGWPVDAETGRPLALTDEEREALKQAPITDKDESDEKPKVTKPPRKAK
jgi:hypothetical protein